MTDQAILEARLTEAEEALHKLRLGQAAVSVSYDGRDTSFKAANIAQLIGYVEELRRALGKPGRRRGIGVRF